MGIMVVEDKTLLQAAMVVLTRLVGLVEEVVRFPRPRWLARPTLVRVAVALEIAVGGTVVVVGVELASIANCLSRRRQPRLRMWLGREVREVRPGLLLGPMVALAWLSWRSTINGI